MSHKGVNWTHSSVLKGMFRFDRINCGMSQMHELLLLLLLCCCCCCCFVVVVVVVVVLHWTQRIWFRTNVVHSVGNKKIHTVFQFTLHQPVKSGVRKSRAPGPVTTEAPPPPRNLLHVTLLSPRILRWLPDFWEICGPTDYLNFGPVCTSAGDSKFFTQLDFLEERFCSRLGHAASSKE